jgi:hypothetical protein
LAKPASKNTGVTTSSNILSYPLTPTLSHRERELVDPALLEAKDHLSTFVLSLCMRGTDRERELVEPALLGAKDHLSTLVFSLCMRGAGALSLFMPLFFCPVV